MKTGVFTDLKMKDKYQDVHLIRGKRN